MTRSRFLMFASFGVMFTMSNAQVTTTVDCDLMGLVVNVGSDSNSVNLYHPGGYLTFPPDYNVMEWEFTDSEGNVIHEATTLNDNFIHVVHNLPVSDTLFVSVLLTNDSAFHNGAPVACLIEDYVFWEVDTWPNSGDEYGTWTLGGSVGEDVSETVEVHDKPRPGVLALHPQPATDHVLVSGLPQRGRLVVRNLSGTPCLQMAHGPSTVVLDLSSLPGGVYLLQSDNAQGEIQGLQKVMVVR